MGTRLKSAEIVRAAYKMKTVIPGFNIPYLPMMEPVVRALVDSKTLGFVMVARLEWIKFRSGGVREIAEEYRRVCNESFTRLHLDHVPVIDEDNLDVGYAEVIKEALGLGYDSVMVDGSRLPLAENMKCTREIVELASDYGAAVEGELGAVFGHEAGPLPPYAELFASGKGFTDVGEALKFHQETGVDWLSVAVGNIHGAISAAKKTEGKIETKLDIKRIAEINKALGIPLVLHGGTGIRKEYILEGVKHGIAKINVATAIRQPYEKMSAVSVEKGQQAVYETMLKIIRDELHIEGTAEKLTGNGGKI
ncbi:MAG: class II fructose-bisphosphate aldolase [Victivallales bacterium]